MMRRRVLNESSVGRFRDIMVRARLHRLRPRESGDPLGINDLVGRERHKAWLTRTRPQRAMNHDYTLADRAVRRLIGRPKFAPVALYLTGRRKRLARKRERWVVA